MTTVRRAVRMSEEAWRAIKVAAATDGITMGEWIEKAMTQRRGKIVASRRPAPILIDLDP